MARLNSSDTRIGILTSGGDCAGLNAVIRAVVQRAVLGHGWQVIGIRDGTHGLLERPLRTLELTEDLFTGTTLRMGGTILGTTNYGDPFAYEMPDGSVQNRSDAFVEGYRELGLQGLIAVGGDGSLKIIQQLCELGPLNFIGVPKTIDNDVPLTEFAVGFPTAVDAAVDALDRLQPTAASHQRIMILEVMGRDAGHIALSAGIAGGADVILIPEIPYDMASVAKKITTLRDGGRNHALVVCAEAARPLSGAEAPGEKSDGAGNVLAAALSAATDAEVRVTVLGHIQRGGTPCSQDRMLASAFGVRAVDLLAAGKSGRMVAWQHRQVVDLDLAEVNARKRPVDRNDTMMQTARGLDICFGD